MILSCNNFFLHYYHFFLCVKPVHYMTNYFSAFLLRVLPFDRQVQICGIHIYLYLKSVTSKWVRNRPLGALSVDLKRHQQLNSSSWFSCQYIDFYGSSLIRHLSSNCQYAVVKCLCCCFYGFPFHYNESSLFMTFLYSYLFLCMILCKLAVLNC